ncbi:hypothetical protein ACQEU3_11075 [Spirillospora sp. CA-253888]
MGPNQEHADDASTGPLPIIRPDGRPAFGVAAGPAEERGAVPPPGPGDARERPAADDPPAREVPAEPLRQQGPMTAAVLGALLVLAAGVVAAWLWA